MKSKLKHDYALKFIFHPRFRGENGGVSNKCIYAFPLEVKTYIALAHGRVHGENSLLIWQKSARFLSQSALVWLCKFKANAS